MHLPMLQVTTGEVTGVQSLKVDILSPKLEFWKEKMTADSQTTRSPISLGFS